MNFRCSLALLGFSLCASSLLAQQTLRGRVDDTSGAAIANATVTLTCAESTPRTTRSERDGAFTIAVEGKCERGVVRARAEGFGDALHAVIRHDIRERLGTIEMPTMLVWGQSDRVIPMSAALSYHRRIPHSRLEIFERTGHVPQLERPARFNAVLDSFLAE